jgi:hypothetical protein
LLQKRRKTAFTSNFVNRSMKTPIIVKRSKKCLKVPPFGTVTYL